MERRPRRRDKISCPGDAPNGRAQRFAQSEDRDRGAHRRPPARPARMSQKLLDFALPPAGAVVYFLDKFHSRMVLGIWWAVLTLICIGNRMVLDRASPPLADIVRRARIRARTQVVTCFLLTAVWSSVAIWACPILVVATSVVASFRSSRMPRPIPVVVGLSVIYVVLMVWQACMIQIGSMRTLRLESERSDLIESLRKAK